MSDIEDNEAEVVKKQKKEKRVKKKKAEEDENDAPEVASKDGKKNKKKRKRDEVQLTEEEIALAKAERNRKKWKKRDAKAAAKSEAARTDKTENPIQFRGPTFQQEFMWNALSSMKEVKTLTAIEMDETKIPEDAFVKPDEDEWKLEDAPKIIVEMLGNTGADTSLFLSKPKTPTDPFGAPIVLVVARTAIRCVEIIEHLMPLRKYAHFGSLFAKHKKAAEQASFLNNWHCQIAIGTPNRIRELLSVGALKFDRLKLIVLDSQIDNKAVSLLDAFETRTDFLSIYKEHLRPKVAGGSAKFAFL